MFPILQIGPLALQTPGLFIIIGIWLGLSTSERFASRFHIDPNQLYNLVLVSLLAGIVGGRLAYAINYSSIFIANPLNIFSLTLTMFSGEAGLVAGSIAGVIYGQRKSLPFWPTVDALAPGMSVFMVFFHLANFASGDAFGSPVQMPFAIELWGQTRHPVQIYEMAAGIAIFAAIIIGIRRLDKNIAYQPGSFLWAFLAFSALARLFFEFFRGDSTTFLGGIHVAQVVAWIILAISLWQIKKYHPITHTATEEPTKVDDHAS